MDAKRTDALVFRIGGQDEQCEAPSDIYLARCVHIEPDWAHIGSKVALYFRVESGKYEGHRARLFYRKRKPVYAKETGSHFGPRSKLARDLRRIYPDQDFNGQTDVNLGELFLYKIFRIKVKLITVKDGSATNAIVTDIEHPDLAED